MLNKKSPEQFCSEQANNAYLIASNSPKSQVLCLDCGYYRKPLWRAFCALNGETLTRMDLPCLFFTPEKVGGEEDEQ